VAIVDAYDDPNAEKDLAVYRQHSACRHARPARLFKKEEPNGCAGTLPTVYSGWGLEISLDLRPLARPLARLPHPAGL